MRNSVSSPGRTGETAVPAAAHHVCPWWIGYLLASPVRRIFQQPENVLALHSRPGLRVLEPGRGRGWCRGVAARLAGAAGRVIGVDIEPRMLAALRRRAATAGVLDRLDTRLAAPDSLGLADLAGAVDFTLAFAVVHELPAAGQFFREVARASKPGARMLFSEPKGHVSASAFDAEVELAREAGFVVVASPSIRSSHSALLERIAG